MWYSEHKIINRNEIRLRTKTADEYIRLTYICTYNFKLCLVGFMHLSMHTILKER